MPEKMSEPEFLGGNDGKLRIVETLPHCAVLGIEQPEVTIIAHSRQAHGGNALPSCAAVPYESVPGQQLQIARGGELESALSAGRERKRFHEVVGVPQQPRRYVRVQMSYGQPARTPF
jgi:hypothetical protein